MLFAELGSGPAGMAYWLWLGLRLLPRWIVFGSYRFSERFFRKGMGLLSMLDLIGAYENYLSKVKQASSNTVASYIRDIRQYSDWLRQEEELDVVEAKLQQMKTQ